MEKHKLSHSEDKLPFKCNVCNLKFENKKYCSRHQRAVHYNIYCGKCDAVFDKMENWKEHQWKEHHTSVHSYKCVICQLEFTELTHLRKHIKIHLKWYYCDVCTLAFSNTDTLNIHKKLKHADKEQDDSLNNCQNIKRHKHLDIQNDESTSHQSSALEFNVEIKPEIKQEVELDINDYVD